MKTALSLILNFGLFLFAVLPVFSYAAGLYSEGEYTVDETGAFNYSLPIDVPAGLGGMQPSLSINYNSNAGNGLLGKGWSLGGLSTIHRCGAVKFKDGFVAPVNYDNRDRFCLDGERLIPTAVNQDGTEVTFLTENFSHGRVIGHRSSGANTNFNYFELWDANGTISEYGSTSNSRIETNQDGVPGILAMAWAMNRITDLSGNYLEVLYTEDNANGEYYPDQINYTRNNNIEQNYFFAQVKFTYAPRGGGWLTTYTAGSKSQLTKRLSAITTKVLVGGVLTTHKNYSFSYVNGSAGSIQLSQLQECAYDNGFSECLTPISFIHNTPGASVTYQQKSWTKPFGYFSKSNSTTGAFAGVVDLNGDGLPDLYDAANGFLYTGSANGFSQTSQAWSAPVGQQTIRKVFESSEVSNLIDINGDGLPDYFDPATKNVWLNTGTAFSATATATWNPGESIFHFESPGNLFQRAGLVDWNRDGLVDVYKQNGNLYLNNGDSFQLANGIFTPSRPLFEKSADGLLTMGGFIDINGDGYLDYYYNNGVGTNYVYLFTGRGWESSVRTWPIYNDPNSPAYISNIFQNTDSKGRFNGLMDFNGDGLPDAYFHNNGLVYINDGSGGFVFETYYANVHNGIATSDINGDWRESSGGYDYTFAGWLDLNGDGIPDFYNAKNGNAYIAKAANNRIVGIDNGNHYIGVEYSDLTSTTVYVPPVTAFSYPEKHIQSMTVVSNVTDDNGIGGRNGKTYRYYSAKAHRDHGFAGFQKIEQTDVVTNVKKETVYQQVYPYIGRVSSETISLNGIVLENRSYSWVSDIVGTYSALPDFNNLQIIWSQPETVSTTKYEYNSPGMPIAEITATSTWNDDFHLQSIVEENGNLRTETAYTYITDDIELNIRGKVRREITTLTNTDTQECITRTKEFVYDYNENNDGSGEDYFTRGLLTKELREPDELIDLSLHSVTEYEYNDAGNNISTCVSGYEMGRRCSFLFYTADTWYRFPAWSGAGSNDTTGLMAKTSFIYNNLSGKTVSQKDEKNNQQTAFSYDVFGRLIRTDYPDGSFSAAAYYGIGGGNQPPVNYRWRVVHSSSTSPEFTEYYDMLGRVIRTVKIQPLSSSQMFIIQDTEYDARAQVYRKSRPYLSSGTASWFTYVYDDLGRVISVTNPLNQVTATAYGVENGLFRTVLTNARNKSSRTYKNHSGQVVKTVDENNTELLFTYWPDGNIKTTAVPGLGSTITSYEYDRLGRKISQTDSTSGTWWYAYNSASELLWQQDSCGNVTQLTHDPLGRVIESAAADGKTFYHYDTWDGRTAYGKLLHVDGPGRFNSRYTENIFYDSLLRVNEKIIRVGEEEHVFAYSYDNYSRLNSMTYPTGLTVKYAYQDGILQQVYRENPTLVYWSAGYINPDGLLTQETRGNGLTTMRDTDGLGRVNWVYEAGQRWKEYGYDAVGNLSFRSDLYGGYEPFSYDDLNRLSNNNTYHYDEPGGGDLGNLTYKPDAGQLYYSGSIPHAISHVEKDSVIYPFSYDAAGNTTSYFGRSLSWNSENRLTFIRDQEKATSFSYAANGRLLKKMDFTYQNGSFAGKAAVYREKISETIYVDGLYEVTKANGNTIKKHLIKAGSESVAIYTETTGTNPSTSLCYPYFDHLGSLDYITNEAAPLSVLHRASFDAWGRPRNPADLGYENIPTTGITDLGYTGHRQVDSFGLAHMQGRVYDPLLGRFLSPDPVIQSPYDLQTYNKYAYVRNNPLTFTDPSGYSWLSDTWHDFTHGAGVFLRQYAAPILSIALSGGALTPFASGFISGAVGAALNRGNILKGAITGGFSAAAFNWAGGGYEKTGLRPIQAHFVAGSVSSGFSAAVYGGNMGRAALTGGVSAALGKSVTLHNRFVNVRPGKIHVGHLSATVAAGGVGSYVTGGSFEEGSRNAAAGYAYNFLSARSVMAIHGAIFYVRMHPWTIRITDMFGKLLPHSGALQAGAANAPKAATQLPAALQGGAANVSVYLGQNDTARSVYAGITNNVAVRGTQHGPRFLGGLKEIAQNLTRGEARAIEQAIIESQRGNFQNIINSVSPKHAYYQQAVHFGQEWLTNNGYEHLLK